MSLLETLKNVKAEGYDPKKDRINNGGLLETGVYPVRLISAERDVNKRGQEQVIVKLEVVSGNFAERKETLFLSFDSGLPEFVLERSGKTLLALVEMAEIKLGKGDLDDEEAAAETLKRGIGKQFKMDLRVVPNKKNPDYPYRNYEFSPLENEPFAGADEEFDSLPF